MDSILLIRLKRVIAEFKSGGQANELVIVNRLKEELQYYVLEYLYNNPQYSQLIMYGGTLLRLGYGLERMSEDLDFESARPVDLLLLKQDLEKHFLDKYAVPLTVSVNDRPQATTKLLKLNFDILGEFSLQAVQWKVLRLRMDINEFPEAGSLLQDAILPIVHGGLSFRIRTYSLSTLMASKLLEVLNRTERGIAGQVAACKPRDIYDLLWYLGNKLVPDLTYFRLKAESYDNLLTLFDAIKQRVANLSDDLFEVDLAQFFYDRTEYLAWFSGWRQRFIYLMDQYELYEVESLEKILFKVDFTSEVRYIHYHYLVKSKKKRVHFIVQISAYWFEDRNLMIDSRHQNKDLLDLIEHSERRLTETDQAYIGVFYQKIEKYLAQCQHVVEQSELTTKVIRATADELNPTKQIYLDRRLLEKIEWQALL